MKNYRRLSFWMYILAMPFFVGAVLMMHSDRFTRPKALAVFLVGVLVFNLADYYRKKAHNQAVDEDMKKEINQNKE